jgi:pyruvate dehydrogenase (quinone)
MELLMPPHVEVSQVIGTALYSAKALLGGRSGDVMELIESNFLQ